MRSEHAEWLRNLNGTGAHEPASSPGSRAVAESLLGPGPVSWAVDVGQAMAQRIVSELPAFGLPTSAPDLLRMGTESTTLDALLRIYTDSDEYRIATNEALLGDREFVHRGVPLDAVLRGIRLSHAFLVRLLLQEAARSLEDPQRSLEMERISQVLFDYVDDFSSAMTQEYAHESERWTASGSAARAESVRAILDDYSQADIDDVSRALSYPLAHHHVAATVWRDDANPSAEDLLQVAGRLVAPAGATGTLLVPDGTNTVWIWVARAGARGEECPIGTPTGTGVHVTIGSSGKGLAGFRRSHREASQAAAVLQATTPMSRRGAPTSTLYTDVELAVLVGQNLPLARSLVTRELGKLAEDSPTALELRQTAAAYLETNRSLAHAGEILHVARNTVAYRIKKVEALLGRDLYRRRLELEVALRVADQLGRAVLIRPTA